MDEAIASARSREEIAPPAIDANSVYIAFDIVESGDAPSYLQNRQYKVWQDPKRGSVPINWSLGPALMDLAPPIAEYFFRNASPNDHLYMALSGAGYCHPLRGLMTKASDSDGAWRQYLSQTRRYLQRMRCVEIGLYTDAWKHYESRTADPVLLRYARDIPELSHFILGMGRDEGIPPARANYVLEGSTVHVSHILTRWDPSYAQKTREENIINLVEDIRRNTAETRPAFMHVMALSWVFGPSEISDVCSRLGREYKPVLAPVLQKLLENRPQ